MKQKWWSKNNASGMRRKREIKYNIPPKNNIWPTMNYINNTYTIYLCRRYLFILFTNSKMAKTFCPTWKAHINCVQIVQIFKGSTHWISLSSMAGSQKPAVWEITKCLWFHAELFLTSSSRRFSTNSSSLSHSLYSWRLKKTNVGNRKRLCNRAVLLLGAFIGLIAHEKQQN